MDRSPENFTSLTLSAIKQAAERLRPVVHQTPLLTSRTLNALTGAEVFIKCENFQRIGAFKIRGAYNAMAQLSAEQLRCGVLAYSSGNHAQALALSARLLGSHAVILMPSDAPQSKIDATRGYGAEVIFFDRYKDDRFALSAALSEQRGLTLIPPCEHFEVMAGQGTVALEMLAAQPDLDALLIPVGGGGLISGCAVAAKSINPAIKVIGIEPEESDDTKQSLEQGRRVSIPMPHTIADGQAAGCPGEMTFEVMRRFVDHIELVNEAQIKQAMGFLFERMKLVVEPSGATPLAALLAQADAWRGKRVGVVISGGNISLERFVSLLS